MGIVRVVIQHFGDEIKHAIDDSISGDVFVAKTEDLFIYYRKSRYHKRLKDEDLSYHACLVAQVLGYHARNLESQLKTRKSPKKAKKQDADGLSQKELF